MTEACLSDTSGLRRVFTKPNFDVNRFVRNTLRDWNQSTETMVERLAVMSEEASSKMKQAIFENYKLFIKAGKTATILEATMHQIHSEFAEMEQVVNAVGQLSLFNERLPDSSVSSVNSKLASETTVACTATGPPVASIFDTIQGSSQVLCDDLSRRVIHDGCVLELSADTQSVICVARLVLLNDLLIIAYKQPGRSGETQFRIQTLYSLENVSLVTTVSKDRRHSPANAFKLTVSNITRMFQAEDAGAKQTWVRLIEETKRSFSASHQTESAKSPVPGSCTSPTSDEIPEMASSASAPFGVMPSFVIPPDRASAEAVRDACKALASTLPKCSDLLNPSRESGDSTFGRKKDVDAPAGEISEDSSAEGTDKKSLTWLWGVPEDLEVAISERDFTHATDLIIKSRSTLDQLLYTCLDDTSRGNRSALVTEARSNLTSLANRIDRNEANLTEALQQELITAADGHGAPSSMTSAILNLSRLGKATLAAQLFLLYRSNLMIKSLTRGIRQEGNQLLYLNRLSFAFHRGLAETVAEWRKIVVCPLLGEFRKQMQIKETQVLERLLSLRFSSWVLEEAHKFGDQLRALLIDSRSISFVTLTLASQCIAAHAEKITTLLGVDILSVIQDRLIPTWKKAAETQSHILKDTVESRAKEESWEPLPVKQAQEQEKELSDLGLIKRSSESGLSLTSGSFYLIRSLHYFTQSCRRLQCEEMEPTVNHCVASILQTELKNYQEVLSNPKLTEKKPIIVSNLEFLVHQIIPKLVKQLNGLQYEETRKVLCAFKDLLDRSNAEATSS